MWQTDGQTENTICRAAWSQLKIPTNIVWCVQNSSHALWYSAFLAATKQLYKWYFPSVCPSVCLSHLFHHVSIIVSSWNFQELLPWSKVMSMQKVKVRGQRSRSQSSLRNSPLDRSPRLAKAASVRQSNCLCWSESPPINSSSEIPILVSKFQTV